MLPPTMRPGASIRPMTEKPVMLLPEPDSPTSPRTSPAPTRRSTPSTALTTPPWVKKWVCRPCTSRTGALTLSAGIVRIEDVAQVVAHEVDADDGQRQRDAGEERDPVMPAEHELEAIGDQHAQRGLGHRDADAEEGQRRLQRDRVRQVDGRDHDQGRHA